MARDDRFYRTKSIDRFLRGGASEPSIFASVHNLTAQRSLTAGMRVTFKGDNLEALLSYPGDRCPAPGDGGTVVKVRTSSGDTTEYMGGVYVLWDDGELRPIKRQHLSRAKMSKRTSDKFSIRASGFGDLSAFFSRKNGSSDLIHKATNDLWSLRQEDDQFVIERLFDSNGEPLKE